MKSLQRLNIGIGHSRFGQEAFEAFSSGIGIQVLLLVTGVLSARILGADGRGQQGLIFIVTLTSAQIGMFGLPAAVTHELASRGASPHQLLRHVRPLVLAQMAAICLIYGLVSMVAFQGRIPAGPALIALAALPAMIVYAYGLAFLQGKHKFRELHVLRVLPSALFAVGLLIGAATGGRSLLMVISIWTASAVLSALISFLYLRWRWNASLTGKEAEEITTLSKLARFGATGFLGYTSPVEMLRVDQIVVGVFLTTTDLGLYMAALALCSLPLFLAQGLGLLAYPKIAAIREYEEKRRLLVRYASFGFGVCGVVCALLAIGAGPIIDLLFGPTFEGATRVSQILLAATVIACVRRILSDGMRGANAPGAGSVAEAVSLVALVPLALLLMPSLGLVGFAWAMLGSYSIGLAVILGFFTRAK